MDVLLGILNDDHIDSVEFKSCEMFMYRDDVRDNTRITLCAHYAKLHRSAPRDEIFSAVGLILKTAVWKFQCSLHRL